MKDFTIKKTVVCDWDMWLCRILRRSRKDTAYPITSEEFNQYNLPEDLDAVNIPE